MGSSPRGILYYGFPLIGEDGFEYEFPWDSDEYEWYNIHPKTKDVEDYEERWKIEEEIDCEIDFSGYDSNFTHYVAIASSQRGSEWGEMTDLSAVEFTKHKEEWDTKIKEFCDVLGIEYQQPKWYLTSMWF